MSEITWMGREQFLKQEAWKGAIAISIINPIVLSEFDIEMPTKIEDWFDFHQILFDDVESNEKNCFTSDMANDLMAFIQKHINADKDWVIHCEAGLSRSAAVARIVHEITGLPFEGVNVPDFRFANGHVLRLMHQIMWENGNG